MAQKLERKQLQKVCYFPWIFLSVALILPFFALLRSVRRKYGIPDNNNEPFNVAYAKAAQRRREMAQRTARQQASLASSEVGSENASTIGQDQAGPSIPRRRIVPTPRMFVYLPSFALC